MDKIRKGDNVIAITGKDKGKRGVVLRRVDAERLVVEGINRVDVAKLGCQNSDIAGTNIS